MSVRKPVFLLLIVMLVISTIVTAPVLASGSNDDITGITLEEEMRAMIEQGVMKGYGEGIYKPGDPVTRGQFATFISRALKLPDDVDTYFKDVPLSSPLAADIHKAASAGLIDGYGDGNFGMNNQITRGQMAKIIGKSLEFLQVPLTQSPLNFKDVAEISPSFKEYVAVNAFYGIIKGIPQADGSVYFQPNKAAKRDQAAALIYRMLETAKQYETDPEPEPEPEPVPEPIPYKVATISNGELIDAGTYETYEEALAAWNGSSSRVITYEDDIIKMKSGIAVTIPTTKGSLTNIYNQSMTSAATYVTYDTELRFLDADVEKVKIEIAGRTGYVKHENVELIPLSLIDERSYYKSVGGELYHYIYFHQKGYYVSYKMGKAPSFMNESERYYSWDGINFMTTTGQTVGTAYQYFQFLSARTATHYTAEELDNFIETKMKELGDLYNSNPSKYSKYKDAGTKSKLLGMGTHLKKVEAEKKVNALHILALAFHESNYGMSIRAQEYNNLFGLRVYDDNPANDVFETVEDNIDALVVEFWGLNYIPPNAKYANGAVFGNKGIGFNVKYASDPYWGAKAAGHAYRIDQALGGKDLANAYVIGLTNSTGLNIRSTPQIDNNKLFTYSNTKMPVVLLDQVQMPDRTWVKIISDDIAFDEVYAAGEYVEEIPVVK